MESNSLRGLWVDELKDLYNAENQLVKALPKLAKSADSAELRKAFEEHLEQTRGHANRLEQIFKKIGESPKGKKCKGMEGLIQEGSEMLDEDYEDGVKDAAIISAAQRVEHYEIAGYGTVRTWAELLGENDAVSLLEQTLQEEKDADEKLNEIAESINVEAQSEGGGTRGLEKEAEEEEESAATTRSRARGKGA